MGAEVLRDDAADRPEQHVGGKVERSSRSWAGVEEFLGAHLEQREGPLALGAYTRAACERLDEQHASGIGVVLEGAEQSAHDGP